MMPLVTLSAPEGVELESGNYGIIMHVFLIFTSSYLEYYRSLHKSMKVQCSKGKGHGLKSLMRYICMIHLTIRDFS
jgi:hypothetical protein